MLGETRTLHPIFKQKINLIFIDLKALGWQPIIASGMRTNQEQDALYAQGRNSLAKVNTLRRKVHFAAITEADNQDPVTYAKGGQSNHNRLQTLIPEGRNSMYEAYSYAVDIVDQRYYWDGAPKSFWRDLGRCAKRYGCEWGGDWHRKDPAHVQIRLIDSGPITSAVV